MEKRGTWLFVGGVAAVLIVVITGYWIILGPGPVSEPVAPPPLPTTVLEPPRARLLHADGTVEVKLGEGEWSAARAGTDVGPNTALRTGRGGRVAVAYGDSVSFELGGESQLQLEALDEKRARVLVREGLVVADVQPDGDQLVQVLAANSDAVAETRDGRLHVLTDGQGRLQAAVSRGTARVSARGESVELEAGYQTAVEPGKPPAQPTLLPKSLLLKIKWPPTANTAKKRHLISGQTNPGSRVRVGDKIVTADSNGRFRAIIQLNEGANEIGVEALDVLGRVESQASPAIELDTRAPAHAIQTNPDMWKRPKR